MTLAKRNYKVYANIGHDKNLLVRKLAVLDTGAGPNFVRATELEPGYRSKLRYGPLPRITDANRNPIRAVGVISLILQVGNYVIKDDFIVCERLAAPLIVGCDLCDKYVEAIYPRRRTVELADGSTIPIVRRPMKRHASAPPLPAVQEHAAQGRDTTKVKVCKAVKLLPWTQTWVNVTTPKSGLILLQPYDKLYESGLILETNGVAQVDKDRPFRILIANFGNNPYQLAKNQVVGTALPHPAAIIPTRVTTAEVLGIEPDDAGEPTSEEELHIGPPMEEPGKAPDIKTVDELDLSHVEAKYRPRLRNMLRKYADMWDGSLGEITVTGHQIDLVPGSRPITQQPYRAGPRARKFEKARSTGCSGTELLNRQSQPGLPRLYSRLKRTERYASALTIESSMPPLCGTLTQSQGWTSVSTPWERLQYSPRWTATVGTGKYR